MTEPRPDIDLGVDLTAEVPCSTNACRNPAAMLAVAQHADRSACDSGTYCAACATHAQYVGFRWEDAPCPHGLSVRPAWRAL